MQSKSKIAAGLFAFFLGCFGVHNFYLGYVGKGIIQVCLYALCCILVIPGSLLVVAVPVVALILSLLSLCCSIPLLIWCVVEGICILTGKIATDAKGIPLQ